jgi:hypothetical protein
MMMAPLRRWIDRLVFPGARIDTVQVAQVPG